MRNVEISWFSGKGKGGQHRNKHQNCCRVIHKETGISAVGQRHRSRERNLKDALHLLAAKLRAYFSDNSDRRQQRSTERVRTYHVVESAMIDHASGLRISCIPIDDLDAFDTALKARKAALAKNE